MTAVVTAPTYLSPYELRVSLVVAEDTKSIWPFYHPAPVFRGEYLNNNEEAAQIANEVTQTLTLEKMQQLNGRVDLDNESPEDVARDHLEEEGLI